MEIVGSHRHVGGIGSHGTGWGHSGSNRLTLFRDKPIMADYCGLLFQLLLPRSYNRIMQLHSLSCDLPSPSIGQSVLASPLTLDLAMWLALTNKHGWKWKDVSSRWQLSEQSQLSAGPWASACCHEKRMPQRAAAPSTWNLEWSPVKLSWAQLSHIRPAVLWVRNKCLFLWATEISRAICYYSKSWLMHKWNLSPPVDASKKQGQSTSKMLGPQAQGSSTLLCKFRPRQSYDMAQVHPWNFQTLLRCSPPDSPWVPLPRQKPALKKGSDGSHCGSSVQQTFARSTSQESCLQTKVNTGQSWPLVGWHPVYSLHTWDWEVTEGRSFLESPGTQINDCSGACGTVAPARVHRCSPRCAGPQGRKVGTCQQMPPQDTPVTGLQFSRGTCYTLILTKIWAFHSSQVNTTHQIAFVFAFWARSMEETEGWLISREMRLHHSWVKGLLGLFPYHIANTHTHSLHEVNIKEMKTKIQFSCSADWIKRREDSSNLRSLYIISEMLITPKTWFHLSLHLSGSVWGFSHLNNSSMFCSITVQQSSPMC